MAWSSCGLKRRCLGFDRLDCERSLIRGSGEAGWDHQYGKIMSYLLGKYGRSHEQLDRAIESVGALFARKFWFRVWILQEVELAKDVVMFLWTIWHPNGLHAHGLRCIARFGRTTKLRGRAFRHCKSRPPAHHFQVAEDT
jgi:hypothetical protein